MREAEAETELEEDWEGERDEVSEYVLDEDAVADSVVDAVWDSLCDWERVLDLEIVGENETEEEIVSDEVEEEDNEADRVREIERDFEDAAGRDKVTSLPMGSTLPLNRVHAILDKMSAPQARRKSCTKDQALT